MPAPALRDRAIPVGSERHSKVAIPQSNPRDDSMAVILWKRMESLLSGCPPGPFTGLRPAARQEVMGSERSGRRTGSCSRIWPSLRKPNTRPACSVSCLPSRGEPARPRFSQRHALIMNSAPKCVTPGCRRPKRVSPEERRPETGDRESRPACGVAPPGPRPAGPRWCRQFMNTGLQVSVFVIVAEAAIQNPVAGQCAFAANGPWIPAFSGMAVNMTTPPER